MRARLINEAIKYLTGKSTDEIWKDIKNDPILDLLEKMTHKKEWKWLEKYLLPLSKKSKLKIRKEIKDDLGGRWWYRVDDENDENDENNLYKEFLEVDNLRIPVLDWLKSELTSKIIRVAKTTPNIKKEIETAASYYEYISPKSEFPKSIKILLTRAKELKLQVITNEVYYYIRNEELDILEYIVKFPKDNFKIKRKGEQYFIEFIEFADFAHYFMSTREIDKKFIEQVLSGEGDEFFMGYEDSRDFPDFHHNFLDKISIIYKPLKTLVVNKHPEAKKVNNIIELFGFMKKLDSTSDLNNSLYTTIINATNETQEIANSDEAYKDLKKAIIDFFELSDIKYKNNYIVKISKDGLRKLLALYYDEESADYIRYYPPQYGYRGDIENYSDIFIDVLDNQLNN